LQTDSDQLEFTLPCGLPCVVGTRPYGKTVGAALMLRVGSRDDPARFPGLAHFSEHLAFRGENLGLVEKLTQDGANVNAYTAPSYTHFHVAAHSLQLDDSLTFFANVLRNSPRTAEEISTEQQVFRHELSELQPEGDKYRNEALHQFWRSIIGDPNWRTSSRKQLAGIRRLKPKVVEPFMSRYFHPRNARLAIVAPRPANEIKSAVETAFAALEPTNALTHFENAISSVTPRRPVIKFDGIWYVWIKLVLLTTRSDPTMRFAAALVADQLGGGPHSALFRRLRSNRALAYLVSADDWPDLYRTVVDCFVSVRRRSLFEAFDIMLEEVRRLAAEGVGDEHFETFRRQKIWHHELAMEYPRELAGFYAYEMLRPTSERQHGSQAYLDFVEHLNVDDVNRAVAEMFAPANRYLFIAGPVGPLARFRIRRRLKS
jgi:predicted Zn-dependent peptidase